MHEYKDLQTFNLLVSYVFTGYLSMKVNLTVAAHSGLLKIWKKNIEGIRPN